MALVQAVVQATTSTSTSTSTMQRQYRQRRKSEVSVGEASAPTLFAQVAGLTNSERKASGL